MIIIYISAVLVAIGLLAPTFFLACDFKAYKRVYDTLHLRKFYRNESQVYSHKYGESNDGFVWFIDSNAFRLDGKHYLLDSELTHFSPYSLYWLIKYRRWFDENIDISKLENY